MKRRKQICFVADDQDGCGEYATTMCDLSITNARITRDKDDVTCPLCLNRIDEEAANKYESDIDPNDDDRELIPFLLENL